MCLIIAGLSQIVLVFPLIRIAVYTQTHTEIDCSFVIDAYLSSKISRILKISNICFVVVVVVGFLFL